MKNIFKTGLFALLACGALTACDPQEKDDYSLGAANTITLEQITFTQTTSEKSDNVITFTRTTDLSYPYAVKWDLGNGVTSKQKTVTGEYPLKGDYNVSLTLSTADGTSVSKAFVLNIPEDDFGLIDTPAYRNLTGGIDDADGKVWVIDQWNNFAKEVAEKTGYSVKGHMGLDAPNSYGQTWWGAGPNEKASGDNTWTLYTHKFTFIQNGVQLKIENSGDGYGRKASAESVGGFAVKEISGDDAIFDYAGGNYTFALDESGKYPKLTLSGNAFMGYYCGTQEYEIFYQTDKVMALRIFNSVENQDWVMVYCLEELNVENAEPEIEKMPKAVPLTDNFEDAEAMLPWVAETMGDKRGVVDNPAPVPVNESDKVYRYQKSAEFYSNLSYTAPDYLFDLTTQNKIRVKVFIPSYNDYTAEVLKPQLAVKLQDSSKGGNAWQTQTEIVKGNLEMDKWIELEFDFSSVADRKDYDKIVIQFGAEGHAAPGIFFFDDFEFGE